MERFEKMSADEMRERGLTGDWWENDLYRVLVVTGQTWNGRELIQLSIKSIMLSIYGFKGRNAIWING